MLVRNSASRWVKGREKIGLRWVKGRENPHCVDCLRLRYPIPTRSRTHPRTSPPRRRPRAFQPESSSSSFLHFSPAARPSPWDPFGFVPPPRGGFTVFGGVSWVDSLDRSSRYPFAPLPEIANLSGPPPFVLAISTMPGTVLKEPSPGEGARTVPVRSIRTSDWNGTVYRSGILPGTEGSQGISPGAGGVFTGSLPAMGTPGARRRGNRPI